jgi:Ca-activated chloride channel homolog
VIRSRRFFSYYLSRILALSFLVMLGIRDTFAQSSMPSGCVEISVIYAAESKPYMEFGINRFNQAYATGLNPLSGDTPEELQPLDPGAPCYWIVDLSVDRVTDRNKSSGTVTDGIVNALQNVNGYVERPVIFIPSVSHWFELANYRTNQPIFDIANSPSTAEAAVVIGIWESRLRAIEAYYPGTDIGWEQIFEVIRQGWNVYTPSGGWPSYFDATRNEVYSGHTNPTVSSTGLSSVISEFYAAILYSVNNPAYNGLINTSDLTLDMVSDQGVIDAVRTYHATIQLYSERTTEIRNLIVSQTGTRDIDFVLLEENDLITVNDPQNQLPERMVALYPREGVFIHDHPFGILNAPWVSAQQRQGAEFFRDFVVSNPEVQRFVRGLTLDQSIGLPSANGAGLRPVLATIALNEEGSPYNPEPNDRYSRFGLQLAYPNVPILQHPPGVVMASIQDKFTGERIRRQSAVSIVIDASGSMNDNSRINEAKSSATTLVNSIGEDQQVGLIIYSNGAGEAQPIQPLTIEHRDAIVNSITAIQPSGQTAMFDALELAVTQVCSTDESRIPVIILLSDGADNRSSETENDIIDLITARCSDGRRIQVYVIAYETRQGPEAMDSLNAIATASNTILYPASQQSIDAIVNSIIGKVE